jgi:cell wall-associated NlpC family hydrolase
MAEYQGNMRMPNPILNRRRRGSHLEVRDGDGRWLATFTDDARTVLLAGPRRSFGEGRVAVSHARWVRSFPAPFAGRLDPGWLREALAANAARVADVLAIAMQYIRRAPPLDDENGLQIAGDARYGPGGQENREEGSDFNDYLGVTATYPGEAPDPPERRQFRCLDCSGYLRMVWGYRHHLPGAGYEDRVPLSVGPKPDRSTMPRRAHQIFDSAPGVVVISRQRPVTDFAPLQVGDLVFFDADTGDGPQVDHVGMYLGRDLDGRYRFISSRKARNGPTLGDYHGASLLDGTGLYARSFCGARRL